MSESFKPPPTTAFCFPSLNIKNLHFDVFRWHGLKRNLHCSLKPETSRSRHTVSPRYHFQIWLSLIWVSTAVTAYMEQKWCCSPRCKLQIHQRQFMLPVFLPDFVTGLFPQTERSDVTLMSDQLTVPIYRWLSWYHSTNPNDISHRGSPTDVLCLNGL